MQIQTNRQLKHTKKKKTKKRKLMVGMVLSFFLFCALAAGTVWWKLEDTLSNITDKSGPTISQVEVDQKPNNYTQEPISLVIVGRDTREGLGMMNTDVIIVAALNPKTKHVTMMPIPRDTGVKIPGYKGYSKINSVYARGEAERRAAERNNKPITETGTTLLKKTIEDAIGIPINYYVMTDFEGFEKVVDELGGIEVEVDKSMKYDDPTDGTHIDLEPGQQILNGQQALGFVRHRMDNRGSKYFSSDFDRGNRQQLVIKAVVDKMKSFTGISSFFNVMNVAGEHIRTDLSKEQIKGLVLDFKSVGSENISSIESGGFWDRASSHTIIPQENMEAIQRAFQQEMELEGATFRSTIRVEAPKQQQQPVVLKKDPAKKVESTPKEQTEEAAGQEKPRTKLQPSGDSKKNPTDTTTNQSGTTEGSMPVQVPASSTSETQTPAPQPKAPVTEKTGILQPPVNTSPTEPVQPATQPTPVVPIQPTQQQEATNTQG